MVGLLCGALLCFVWLMALCFGWTEFSLDRLYLATILGVTLSYSSAPIFYEYAVALGGQSCSEVQVGGLMSGGINATTGLFLLVFFIPGLGTSWMNWGLCITTFMAVPMVLKTKLPALDTSGTLHLA